jgi:hypothetical protein
MNFDKIDNIYYEIYLYAIPLLLLFLLIIAIFLLVKNYNLLDLFLLQKEKKFNNFLKKNDKEKKEMIESCIKDYIYLSEEINNTAKNSFKAFKEQEIKYKEEIKKLEKELIKYKNICNTKVRQIERLKRENLKLKKVN